MNYKMIVAAVFTLLGAPAYCSDYKTLHQHGTILYNLIHDYVETNSTQSAQDVTTYINSSATDAVFSDALVSGYSRDKIVFEAYQQSFVTGTSSDVIINGLHDAVTKNETINKAVFYGTFATMGATSLVIMGVARMAWVYFRFDRPALNFFKTHDQGYLQTRNNPSVPEPWW